MATKSDPKSLETCSTRVKTSVIARLDKLAKRRTARSTSTVRRADIVRECIELALPLLEEKEASR